MENLGKIVESISIPLQVEKECNKGLYKGLELIEERNYTGGTGIKYWM